MIFWTSLFLGLGSSLHCIGMCGPLALALPLNRQSKLSMFSGILQYQAGRILTYSLLGLLTGLIGLSAGMLGFMQWLSIISGVIILLLAWKKWVSRFFDRIFPFFSIYRFISAGMGSVLASNPPFKLFLLGMVNGFLPCGMVYAALVNALVSGNGANGALAMAVFGAGTLPAMVLMSYAANHINGSWRKRLNRTMPIFMSVIALLIILRGANLNIPYLSPGVTISQQHLESTGANQESQPRVEAKMSCCHNKTSCKTK